MSGAACKEWLCGTAENAQAASKMSEFLTPEEERRVITDADFYRNLRIDVAERKDKADANR